MNAVVFEQPGSFSIVDIPRPRLVSPTGVIIRVLAAAICKTDVHIFEGNFPVKFPMTPGHEFAGEVLDVGDGVSRVAPGQSVVVDPTIPCGSCRSCRAGHPEFCSRFRCLGNTDPGGFAEYVLADESQLYPLGDELSPAAATFAEPLSCAIHAVEEAGVGLADEVLVVGAGSNGQLLIQSTRSAGARVTAADPNPDKIELAKDLGADHVMLIGRDGLSGVDGQFDVIIDTTGNEKVIATALRRLYPGGALVLFGVPKPETLVPFNAFDIYRSGIRIVGVFGTLFTFGKAVDLLRNSRVSVEPLISHRMPLDKFGEGLAITAGRGPKQKVIITF